MKYIFTFFITLVFCSYSANGQVTVTSDVTHTYKGYMNVFNLSSGAKGSANFDQPWGVAALKTTITSAGTGGFTNGAITLQPNFNGYADNAGNDFWRDNGGAGPGGNKWMEAITYVEYGANAYPGGDLTFKGDINTNTLASGYTAVAFIKTLDPANGHATIIHETVALGAAATSFTVIATGINTAHIVQYGFTVEGINANPTDESTLGSVIITPDTTVLGGGGSSSGPDTAEWDFEDAADGTDFPGVGDGIHATATVQRVTTGGNPNGALRFGGANDVTSVGKAYQVQYSNGSFDYGSAASAKLTFDMKIDESLSAAAVFNHFETKGGGTKTTSNLEATGKGVGSTTLNSSTYTSFEVEATGLTGGTGILRINFQISAGAVVGGGGILLVDNVKVELFDSNGDTLGFVDLDDLDFVAYPNPFTSHVEIQAAHEVSQVRVYNITGQEILRDTPNKARFTLDTTHLSKGVYLLSLESNGKSTTAKMVK